MNQSTDVALSYTARYARTGMQWATLGKSGSQTDSQLQGRTARAFSSSISVKTMEMTVIIQYILTATQSFVFPVRLCSKQVSTYWTLFVGLSQAEV